MIRTLRHIRHLHTPPKLPKRPLQPQKCTTQTTKQSRSSPTPSSQNATESPSPPEIPRLTRYANSARSFLFGTLYLLPPMFLITHFFWTYVAEISTPEGASMLPTIYLAGDIVILSKFHRRGRGIAVGDVVAFHHPIFASGMIKRVIGMPGDFVGLRARDEYGLKGVERYDWADEWGGDGQGGWVVQVPKGHCWVEGDDLNWSRDSRIIGAVPLGLVRGKVVCRLLPWRERRWFGNGLSEVDDLEVD